MSKDLTEILRTPGGTMSLRPIQAQALYEIAKHKGLFGPIRVGGGKTLISLLTPFVLGEERAVLLLPAALRDKTERERRQLAKHWRVSRGLRILSYEEMGREAQANALEFYRPRLIIADEAHRLKNKRAGVTRRIVRYMREHPETHFVAISGTMIKNSLRNFAHILRWTHKALAPVPESEGELEEWADALDEDSNMFTRSRPGVLLRLAEPEDVVPGDDLRTARRGFQRRLLETPAVVATQGEQVACSLYIEAREFKPNAVTDANFQRLRSTWETPDGWALSQAVDVWRHARELALGLHYAWDPRPPQEWLNARREWAAFVRETLSHSRSLDTELQVAKACASGQLDDSAFRAWQDIRDTFRINSKPVWHDDAALVSCEAWLKGGPGIVWVEHTFFGDELERRTGVPYYREGGLNKAGQPIETHDPKRPLIASVAANATGRNLQAWARNLVTSCPGGAVVWEQLLGRTHRDGQTADQVEVEVLFACIEHANAWERALAEARMTEDTMGQPQKILFADAVFPSVVGRTGPRWSTMVSRSQK